jgi:hypothetical protein
MTLTHTLGRILGYTLIALLIPLFAVALLFASLTTGVRWVWSGGDD